MENAINFSAAAGDLCSAIL